VAKQSAFKQGHHKAPDAIAMAPKTVVMFYAEEHVAIGLSAIL
jgi:hypothetical protein